MSGSSEVAPEGHSGRTEDAPRYSVLSKITQEQVVFSVAVALIVIFSFTVPQFASVGNFFSLLNHVAVLGIVSLGAAIVIIARGLDISQVGSMVIGAGYAAALVASGWSPGWAIFTGLVATTIIGL